MAGSSRPRAAAGICWIAPPLRRRWTDHARLSEMWTPISGHRHELHRGRASLEDIHDPPRRTVIAGHTSSKRCSVRRNGHGLRAHHRLVNRPCAVKVMKPRYATHEVVRERFRREAKAAQKLAHPKHHRDLRAGETDDGCLYLVMELLAGHSLARRARAGQGPARAVARES